MKKFLIMLVAVLVFLAACGQSEDTKDSKEAKTEDKVLTVGTEGTYAPFTFHDKDGKLTGFDVEISKAVADKMGYKVKFVETQWDSMFAGLNSGRFDTVANQVGINEERKAKYQFSKPYTYTSAVLVTRSNSDIKSFDDVKGRKLAQTLTSNYGKLAKDKGAQITQVEGFNQSMELVLSNRVEGTFNEKLSVLDYMKQKKNADVKVIEGDAEKSQSAFVFTKKADKALVDKVNKALDELQKEGELKKISEKWFGEDVTQP
ncbi:amino acid ABC transporter substrate-binding protein [Macrococcus hajekii]|uniref:Amino acid ABC transporter substrate-binding protein n=1 Tax=Macrococcus hajekii TaxID=198482 RepID=A0A4R6BLJ3_9STAP|nr:amino acid ABC transporter substrate-binding protein [Macrococcus hajekii]TDM02659.1 amino acid ABC transporter substrate-binding protein [Macrococcus hajekii]GGB02838.1 amino acid ABC transporter substrate-binding protein [Macrococcus hajekii]